MKIRMSRPRAAAVALSLLLLAASAASAQSSSSALAGRVAVGDTVSLHSVDTGLDRAVPVRADGRYQMRNLPVGTYELTVRHADGSRPRTVLVKTQVGRTTRIN